MRVISQKVGKDRLSNASGWSSPARVARAPLITPTGCLPHRKSRLYICKCCVYAMRVGTMLGNRGCRSHASRWGPVLPDLGIRAHLPLSPLSFSRSPCFPASSAPTSVFICSCLISPPSSVLFSLSHSFSSSFFFSLVFADLGHYIYGRWRYGLPPKRDSNESPWCIVVSS